MYAFLLEYLRPVEGFDDTVAKGPFSDVDFFTPSSTVPYPWPFHNILLPCRLKYTGDRWKEVL